MNDKIIFFAFLAILVEFFLRKEAWKRISDKEMGVPIFMTSVYLAIFVLISERYY